MSKNKTSGLAIFGFSCFSMIGFGLTIYAISFNVKHPMIITLNLFFLLYFSFCIILSGRMIGRKLSERGKDGI